MRTFKSLATQFEVPEEFLHKLADQGILMYMELRPNRFADPEEVARALAEHLKEAQEILGRLIEEAQEMGLYL